MHRKLLLVPVVAVILLISASFAQAITFGWPDGNLHPNVGALLYMNSAGELGVGCSGTLIAPDVFLTAAHCVSWMEPYGVPLDQVWVSFDSEIDADSPVIQGTAKPNPNYGHDMNNPHDVAVVILWSRMGTPLPEEFYLPIHQSYAQEPLIDAMINCTLETVYGREPRSRSPWEVLLGWHELELTKAACQRAAPADDVLENIEACEKLGMKGIHFKDPESALKKLKALL